MQLGVYTVEQGKPRFHRVNAPAQDELEALLTRIITRITRQLQRDGLLVTDEPQPYLDLDLNNTLDQFGAQSIQYRVILGTNAGSRTLSLRNPVQHAFNTSDKPFTTARDGFSMNAANSKVSAAMSHAHRWPWSA